MYLIFVNQWVWWFWFEISFDFVVYVTVIYVANGAHCARGARLGEYGVEKKKRIL